MSTLRAFDPLAPPTTPTNSSWFEIHLYVLLYFATKLQHNPHATKHHEKYCQRFQENVNQNQEKTYKPGHLVKVILVKINFGNAVIDHYI